MFGCWLVGCLTSQQRVSHVWLLVACLTSQQHAGISQGRICSDTFACCYTEIEVADQTFYLTQSQNTDTGPTSPSADLVSPGSWQGSYWSANFEVTGMTRPGKIPTARASCPDQTSHRQVTISLPVLGSLCSAHRVVRCLKQSTTIPNASFRHQRAVTQVITR